MPDEGAPTYQQMLSNMQEGLRYIEEEFGTQARPRVAWSIDPFGHRQVAFLPQSIVCVEEERRIHHTVNLDQFYLMR